MTDARAAQLKDLVIEVMRKCNPDLADKPIPADADAQIDLACANVVKGFDILMAKPQ